MLKASLKNPALQRYWIQCLYSAGVAVYCFDGHDAVGWNRYYSRLLSLHRSLLLLWSWPLNLSRCYSRKTITTHLRKYNHNRITDAVQNPLFSDECGHDLCSKYSGIHLFFHPGDVGKYSFKVEWRLEESLRILVRKTAKAAEAVSRRRKQHSPLIFRRKKEALQHENLCMDSKKILSAPLWFCYKLAGSDYGQYQ